MNMLKKMLGLLIALLIFAGCPQGKSEKNVAGIDALKAHLVKNYSSIKINPLAEAFAGLVSDPVQQQEIIDKAKAGYVDMNIQDIYLVSGPTAESNEAVFGSLIHFNNAMTIDEAKAQLAKDSNFKDQEMDIVMNKNFAFAVATMNGKKAAPKSVITAFESYK